MKQISLTKNIKHRSSTTLYILEKRGMSSYADAVRKNIELVVHTPIENSTKFYTSIFNNSTTTNNNLVLKNKAKNYMENYMEN